MNTISAIRNAGGAIPTKNIDPREAARLAALGMIIRDGVARPDGSWAVDPAGMTREAKGTRESRIPAPAVCR